jgi:hypothetical protein
MMKLFCGDRHWLALVLPVSGVIHPLLHCVHCRLPPDDEKKPWAQMVQTVAPSTPLAQPALQGWQVVLPRELEKEPAGHCCCEADPMEVVKEPEVAARLAGLSIETRPGTPEDFLAFYKAELAKWTRVVREANITLD